MNKTERLSLENQYIIMISLADSPMISELMKSVLSTQSVEVIKALAPKESNLPFEEALKEKGSVLHNKKKVAGK